MIKIEKEDNFWKIKTDKGSYQAISIIVASGAHPKRLGIEGEDEFLGRGVSFGAVCDAPFFKNKTVGVVGGANAAVEAALLLSEFAQKVYIIYRKDKLRAVPYLVEKIKQRKNIEVLYNNTVKKINGKISVESVKLDNEKELKMDGLFVEIGHVPNYQLAEKLGVKISEDKRVVVDQNMSTNIAGFFAAGDVTTGSNKFDQIITAAAEGAIAASAAYKFILKGDD